MPPSIRPDEGPGPLSRRLIWFVGLWAAGVVAVGLFSLLIRLVAR